MNLRRLRRYLRRYIWRSYLRQAPPTARPGLERVASFESFAKYEAAHLLTFVTFLKFLPVPEALLPSIAGFYAHAGCY